MKIFLAIFLCIASLQADSQNIWQFNSNFPGVNRHAGISFCINQKGYIGTGFSSNNQWLQDIWEYDPTTASWSQKANFPIWVYAATSFTIDSFVYVTNGWETQSANSNTYKYDPLNDTWSQVAPYPGTPAYTTVSFVINHKAYVGMGYTPLTNEIWEYDPVSDVWTQKSNYPGLLRQNASAVVVNDIAYVGCGGNQTTAFNDFYAYDAVTDTWTPVAPLPGIGRVGAMEFELDDKVFICGGFDLTNYLRDVWVYDPFNNSWQQYPDFGGAERFQGMNFTLGNSVYVGLGRSGTYHNDFWEYTPTGANSITGRSFRDNNSNGVPDSGDAGFNNFLFQVLPSGNIYSTDHSGYFEAAADSGTYTVTPLSSPAYYIGTPASNSITFPGTGLQDMSSFFAYAPIGTVQNLAIDATALTNIRPGFTSVINLAITNKGTQEVAQAVAQIQLPLTLTITQALPSDSTNWSNDTLNIYIDSIAPGEIRNIQVRAVASTSLTIGDTILINVGIMPDSNDVDITDNHTSQPVPVIASFDPNDIQVNPAGPVPVSEVLNGKWLTYTIRFQNTGTASAEFVRIADSIPVTLDLSTLEFICSSHSCQLELNGDRVVKYFFNNINLPDSTTDFEGSNGFVKFRIRIVTSTPIGTDIYNEADIYFDYNPPVLTNSVLTSITTNTGFPEQTSNSSLLLYPNPATNHVKIVLPVNYHPGTIELYSSSGTRNVAPVSPTGEIIIYGYAKGLYILRMKDANGNYVFGKLVIP